MAPRRVDPQTLARDATFRPAKAPANGVLCKQCGQEHVIPIPIWDLTVESDEPGVLVVPVALVCLDCHAQSVYWAKWRSDWSSIQGRDREETDG
jgi:hypothetical protein